MALSQGQKYGYSFCLILTILLVGLHLAVVSHGYRFSRDWKDDRAQDPISFWRTYTQLYFDEIKQETAFIIIAAAFTLIFSIVLLAGLCTDCISIRTKHILATLNIILEFAIAVVLALRASNNSNLKDSKIQPYSQYSDFRMFYRLVLADTIITFVLQVVYMLVIYMGTFREITHSEIITPVVAEVPPLSNRQF